MKILYCLDVHTNKYEPNMSRAGEENRPPFNWLIFKFWN